LGDAGFGGKVTLKRILKKQDLMTHTGFVWFRVVVGDKLL